MRRFRVEKLTASGKIEQIVIEAANTQAIEQIAQDEHWQALRILPLAAPLRKGMLARTRLHLSFFSQELKALLEAGLSINEVLTSLAERESHPSQQNILLALKRSITQGQGLSEAMAEQPEHFPPLYVATIRSGERTGDLPNVIGRYLAYTEQLDELKRKLLSAITYPALLLGVGSAVVLFLLIYLVPRFSVIYEQVGSGLSWPAQLLLQWGVWAKGHPWLLISMLLTMPMLLFATWRMPHLRTAFSRRLMNNRWVGPHWHCFNVSRYCRSLALLASGGIPLPEAMRLAGGLLPLPLQPRLQQAVNAIEQGSKLSDALANSGLLTSIALRLVRAGERSSNVPSMLEQAAHFHERELAHLLERLGKLIEPLLMLVIGLLIGGIVVLMYLPIFELAGSLRP